MNKIADPYYVDFAITPYCNLKCRFCSASACEINSHNDLLSLEQIEDIFNQFDYNNVMRVSIEGGEPFIRDDILDILDMARKHMFSCYVNTNGTLITEDIARKISLTGIDKLCISIDGTEEIHDKSRGVKESFQKTRKAIHYLHKYEVPMDAIITLTRINMNHLMATFDVIKNLGITNVAIMLLATVGSALVNEQDMQLAYDEWRTILLNLTDLKKNGKLPINLCIVHTSESLYPWEIYLPLHEAKREADLSVWIPRDTVSSLEANEYGCTAGKDNLAIDGYGNVYGCSLMLSHKELIAGNIKDNTLHDIWHYSKLFNQMRNVSIDSIHGRCATCSLVSICRGGCRACAFASSQNLNAEDDRCPICKGDFIWR